MLTAALAFWTILLSAFWRLWLGGTPKDWPFKTGVTAFKYLVGMGLAGGIVWHLTQDWRPSLLAAVAYLAIWRGYGHGPMLQIPLGQNQKDLIKRFIDWVVPPPIDDPDLEWKRAIGANLRWGLYALLRYALPCSLVGFGFALMGYREFPMFAAGVGICAAYWISWHRRLKWDYDIMRWIANISPVRDYRDACQPYSFGHPMAGAALMLGIIGSTWPFVG